ncbi:MAG: endonuclease/exonuclease/phosphatase family protein [Bradyrhizobium sp.]
MKVISWNLLRLTGAGVEDVAALVERHHPDLLFLQEAIEEMADLPALVGGYFFREPMEGRIYGLAVWSPHPLLRPYALRLPVSQVPGRVPPRVAQIVQLGDVTFANVHLSHGQFLNRWQLVHIANALDGPAAIVGDYNAVGPIRLAGFKDVGPRQSTHSPNDIISFRLDRCMARGLRCSYARVLARGSSDHHPISLKLHTLPGVQVSDGPVTAHVRRPMLRVSVERWLRVVREAPARIRVRAKGNHIRNLVQPPPSLHCDLCTGELRLKLIEPADSVFDLDAEIFVCARCGHEQSHVVIHDHTAPHHARRRSSVR